jgi:hypothetical protein
VPCAGARRVGIGGERDRLVYAPEAAATEAQQIVVRGGTCSHPSEAVTLASRWRRRVEGCVAPMGLLEESRALFARRRQQNPRHFERLPAHACRQRLSLVREANDVRSRDVVDVERHARLRSNLRPELDPRRLLLVFFDVFVTVDFVI